MHLLAKDEPAAATLSEPLDASQFVVVCDHASARIPRALGTLGLSEAQLSSHIAWDIGAAGLAWLLARELNASLVVQNYSRLVIDCNRTPGRADSIPIISDRVEIQGNVNLEAAATAMRVRDIFDPYHDRISALLDLRQSRGLPSVLVSMHSFVPVLDGASRPWHIGVMHRHDAGLAEALLRLLRQDESLCVGDNAPYALDDTDYTIPRHGESRGVPHVALELRHDLIADAPGQSLWARRLAALLTQAATHTGDGHVAQPR